MKTSKSKTGSQKLADEIALARLRLAKAESQLKSAKQQARLARRRRKEAKEAARRAKKQAKLAKREVAEAKHALAEAEAKLVRSQKRTVRAKTRKAAASKATAAPHKKKVTRPAAVPLREAAKARVSKAAIGKPASSTKFKVPKAERPIAVPRDVEVPTATTSSPDGEATVQTEKSGGESHAGETSAGSLVEPVSPASQTH